MLNAKCKMQSDFVGLMAALRRSGNDDCGERRLVQPYGCSTLPYPNGNATTNLPKIRDVGAIFSSSKLAVSKFAVSRRGHAPAYEWEELSYQTVIKNEAERTAVTILKINLLNLRNYFVIFCNFPIDEMPFMGYNTAMKKMLASETVGSGVPDHLPDRGLSQQYFQNRKHNFIRRLETK